MQTFVQTSFEVGIHTPGKVCTGPLVEQAPDREANSTDEASFDAIQSCVREVWRVRVILADIGPDHAGPTDVFHDNLDTMRWAQSVQGLRNVKHVGLKYHDVRSMVEHAIVWIINATSATIRVDAHTKVIIPTYFLQHLKYCSIKGIRSPPPIP